MGEKEKERKREPMNIELLSPAGSYQGLQAVIRAGADAVYIGGSRFGARAYADNPDVEELKEAIEKWRYVSVADACDLTGVPSNYSDTKIGWRKLDGASVRTIKTKVASCIASYIGGREEIVDRYYISLPDPIKL